MSDALLQSLRSFQGRLERAMLSDSLIGKEPWSSLLDELDGLIDAIDVGDIIPPIDITRLSTIDQYGLGQTVISLYRDGLSTREIAKSINNQIGNDLTAKDIDGWLENYKGASLSDRQEMLSYSVFDVRSRLEDLHEAITGHMQAIEKESDEIYAKAKTTRVQVKLEAYKELRQLYKDAAAILAALQQLNTIREFQSTVLEVVSRVSPEAYRAIVTELKSKKSLLSVISN
jgi:uncharacterized protein YoxC